MAISTVDVVSKIGLPAGFDNWLDAVSDKKALGFILVDFQFAASKALGSTASSGPSTSS